MSEAGHTERLEAALADRYRIERKLGEGGMASVYLAEDLKHERKVALKVLKPELAAVVGADRFLAEIKTTANLQHPHILPLFDSGEADSFLFYVMPYVDGESLRERLDREHQLPVDEAVQIAKNVAEALGYAHSHGVIHRDIKPANILLQAGKPVVSDFGIALALGAAGAGRLTETGLSLGTPHYMSPEQATGDLSVGAATDIYALACVLYEMLVGEPPYTGSTPQAVLGKIVTGVAPSASAERKSVPKNVDAVIRKALEKVPADRFKSAGELAAALSDDGFRHGAEPAIGAATLGRPWNPVSIAATGLAVLFGASAGWLLARPEAAAPVSREVLSTAGWASLEGLSFGEYLALAPDGESMILPLASTELGLKTRGSAEIVPIRGTEGGRDVVYSPDGQSIAYAVGSELFKRTLTGASAIRLAADVEAPPARVGLTWLDDGTILYEQRRDGVRLVQIAEDGSEPRVVFEPQQNVLIWWVYGLPGSRGALVVTTDNSLHVVDLRDGSSKDILQDVVRVWYTATGDLVYVQVSGEVLALPFDLSRLTPTGSAVSLFVGVRTSRPTADMQVGADGTVVYVEGPAISSGATDLVLVDRDGQAQSLGFEPDAYWFPRVSPDGGRLAVAIGYSAEPGLPPSYDLWVLDLMRGSRTRVTFGGNNRNFPVWLPSGDGLTYSDGTASPNTVRIARADGSGGAESLLEREGLQYPTSWSPDGRALAYTEVDPETQRDVWVLPSGGAPAPFLVTPFQERAAVFSPDGRWIAYVSDESGRDEIYAQRYPGPGRKYTVSTDGGREPLWSPDGSELFYRTADQVMAVPIGLGDTLRVGTPRPIFADSYDRDSTVGSGGVANYDVTADGEHFVMLSTDLRRSEAEGGPRVILIRNFFEELRQKVPD